MTQSLDRVWTEAWKYLESLEDRYKPMLHLSYYRLGDNRRASVAKNKNPMVTFDVQLSIALHTEEEHCKYEHFKGHAKTPEEAINSVLQQCKLFFKEKAP